MSRPIFLLIGAFSIVLSSHAQTVISFSVDQPVEPFAVDAGADQLFDGESAVVLGGEPTASGGFGEYNYSWNNEELLDDPSSPNPIVIDLNVSTTFSVSVTDIQGTCIKTDEVNVDYALSSRPENSNYFKSFPNPFSEFVKFESPHLILGIQVFDITGRKIAQINPMRGELIELNTQDYHPGIYLFQIELSDGQTKNLKLCKRH